MENERGLCLCGHRLDDHDDGGTACLQCACDSYADRYQVRRDDVVIDP